MCRKCVGMIKKAGSGWACFFFMALSFLLHDFQILWTMFIKVFICHRHFEGLVRVVTHAPFYYVFTTNDCLNMPRFAPICPLRNIQTKICSFFKTRIMRHTTAYCGISGRRNPMTKILFVCHGSILTHSLNSLIWRDFRPMVSDSLQLFYNFSKYQSLEELQQWVKTT